MRIRKNEFNTENQVYIMGILNVTPDSFSDGGKFNTINNAVKQALRMEREGASLIDVGGESTRPGHESVSADEEISRVVPVITELKKNLSIPISIDTSKAAVAVKALNAGASLLNDVWGFRKDRDISAVAADFGVPCCLMHNRESTVYHDFLSEIKDDLKISIDIALRAGVSEDSIIIDPGIGFGKTVVQNLVVLNNLEIVNDIGFPWLLGASRKSVIGKSLDLPIDERMEGTVVTTVFGVQKGASFIRVHDVKENLRAVEMTRSILEETLASGK